MVILAVLAFAVASGPAPPVQRVAVERQAVAIVRILPGAALRFSEIERNAPQSFRNTEIRTADGSSQPARLVEFQ